MSKKKTVVDIPDANRFRHLRKYNGFNVQLVSDMLKEINADTVLNQKDLMNLLELKEEFDTYDIAFIHELIIGESPFKKPYYLTDMQNNKQIVIPVYFAVISELVGGRPIRPKFLEICGYGCPECLKEPTETVEGQEFDSIVAGRPIERPYDDGKKGGSGIEYVCGNGLCGTYLFTEIIHEPEPVGNDDGIYG